MSGGVWEDGGGDASSYPIAYRSMCGGGKVPVPANR